MVKQVILALSEKAGLLVADALEHYSTNKLDTLGESAPIAASIIKEVEDQLGGAAPKSQRAPEESTGKKIGKAMAKAAKEASERGEEEGA